jgi:type I restriction enzyme, S subunit
MSELPQIPAKWKWSTMGEVAEVVGGGTPKTDQAEYFGGEISWITPADLSGYTEKFISRGSRNITKTGLENSGARLMPAGAVLFSSRAPIGYVAIAANPVSTNQGFKSFVLRDGLTPDYVYYYLQYAKKLAVELASGTTFLEISGKKAAQIPIPVAPVSEQRRIVAEIEKQFTRLEAGVAALRRVQANLKRYRAAVLKAACECKLVPSEGSWRFTELGNVVTFLQGLQVPVPDQRFEPAEGDVPFLRIVNYTQPEKDFRYITDPGAKYHVQDDDVVMVRYGTPGFVGRGFEGVIANNLFRVIPQNGLSKNHLFYFLKSKAVADLIRSRQKGGTMQAISFGQLKDIPIGIPPLAEQTRIVAEVERRLSVVEELESVVSANLQRATRLRQSILQKAFTGQLA